MTCTRCGGKGVVPYCKVDGTISLHAWVPCECAPEEPDYLPPLSPEGFDFPMSSAFRAHTYQYCGVPDPGYCQPVIDSPPPKEVIHRHSDMSTQDFRKLRDLTGQVNYLIQEIGDLKKKKSSYQGRFHRYQD